MNIIRSPERTTEVLDMIRVTFQKPREGIHLTDLLYPRRAYWQRVRPLPLTDTEIQYFLAGRGHEDAMHRITGLVHVGDRDWNGIKYGIDFYDGHPVEMKTRRRWLAEEGQEATVYDTYLNQLKGYCAVENMTTGELWIWSLVEKQGEYATAPKYVAYMVEFTPEELEAERNRMIGGKDQLENAISAMSCSKLPICPTWMCVKKLTEMEDKPYCETCDRAFETDWGIDKHINSNTGRGHAVRKATYKTTITPTCKWYEDCRPHALG
jgi:hypothetical protein